MKNVEDKSIETLDWSVEYKLVNRGVLLGLQQYYDYLKRKKQYKTIQEQQQLDNLKLYIDNLKGEIWR